MQEARTVIRAVGSQLPVVLGLEVVITQTNEL